MPGKGGTLRLGLVGVGLMGEEHLKAFSLVPEITVAGVTDADPERARAAARRYGIEHVAEDAAALAGADGVDAIAVAVPPAAWSTSSPSSALTAGRCCARSRSGSTPRRPGRCWTRRPGRAWCTPCATSGATTPCTGASATSSARASPARRSWSRCR